jgi:hypothetical protein
LTGARPRRNFGERRLIQRARTCSLGMFMRTLKTLKFRQNGHQGAADPVRDESPVRPLPLRRDHRRARRDGRADRPALLARFHTGPTSSTTGRLPYPPSRRLGRHRRSRNAGRPKGRPFRMPDGGPESRPLHPLPRDRPAPASQVRRRPVGPGAPALAPAARSGRAPRPAAPRGEGVGGWMWGRVAGLRHLEGCRMWARGG